MIILLVAFGSVLAMGLPIGTALVRHRERRRDRDSSSPTCVDMPDFTTAGRAR